MYQETLNGNARTNNYCEGFHKGLSYIIGAQHPTFWRFVEGLRKVQRKQEFTLSQTMAGSQPPPKKRKYKDYESRLKNVVSSYNDQNILDYLLNVASNLRFHV